MRTTIACTAVASLLVVLASCKRQDDASQQPTMTPTATAAYPGAPPQGQYPPGQPGQQAPTYNQYPPSPPQPVPPPGAPSPTVAAPGAPSGQMAVPGPVAFQCQNDVPCGTHRCNTQYGKCAFPCQTNVDCLAPNTCMSGLCVPPFLKAPGSP
ncbi:MAG: hypothetical protein ACLP1X_25525 [Polyangiaceae bacterium]|jgi:hypothetical protein